MRILFVQNRYRDGSPGGTEQMCRQLGEGLRVRGHEVAMLTSGQSEGSGVFPKVWGMLSMLNADWMYRGGPAAGALWLANHAWNYLATMAVIKAFRPDAVYLHNSENIQAGPLNAAADSGARVVVHVHNHLYDEWAKAAGKLSRIGRVIKPALERVDFISVSKHMADELEASGVNGARIHTIYNGLPDGIFGMPEGRRRKGTVLFAGHMVEHKGFHVFLEAAVILKQKLPGIRFEAYGYRPSGAYLSRWTDFIRESGLDSALATHPPVARERLWEVFGNSDLLVAPSLYPEAFGLVAAEAMCRGMLVVASNRGGLPEVVRDCGFIVEPEPQEVARACQRALEMPEHRKEAMRRAARERVERLFRFSDQLPAYEAALCGATTERCGSKAQRPKNGDM